MKKLALLILFGLTLTLNAQVAYWEPGTVTHTSDVDIYYNTIFGTLPDNASNVLIHIGVNGWQNVEDLPMTEMEDGWWSFHFEVTEEMDVIDFVFQDGQGNWDNNGGEGIDWHIYVDVPGIWDPVTPGPNDTIRISKQHEGTGGLWWGVNSWSAPIDAYQPEGTVDGDPGLSVETPLMGPDSNDVYWIEIGPFNSPQQVVTQVDFVFRWADGTWEGTGSGDFHLPINFDPTPQDPTVSFLNIEDNHILDVDQQIQVHTEDAVYVEVLIDGSTRFIAGGGDLDFTTNTDNLELGRHQLVAFARRDNGRVMMDVKTVWKAPEVIEEAFPPFDYLGVHDRLDGTVTFAILAPGKRFVSLGADFTNWDVEEGLMKYDPAQGIYWLNVPLEPGEYEYQYMIDGEKVIGDPFAKDVNWTDMFGNEHWAAENQKSVVRIGQDDYPWTDETFTRPAMNDLIIYETLIRDFSPSGDVDGMTAKLDYLAELGINAIELMPPTEFPGESSWGYNPAFFMALESSYGTPDELKHFVNEAHARGIAVLIDLVFNHADGSSPYQQMYGDDYENSPYMHDEANAWGFPDFDHWREGTRKLSAATVRHWIREYHVDGYRYDHTPGIGWDAGNNYGIAYFASQAHAEDNGVYQIAEHFDSDIGSLILHTNIDSHWHDAFHDQMKANLRQGSFEGSFWGDMNKTERGVSYHADGFQTPEACVNYIESHDEQRVIFEAQTNGLNYEQALEKAMLAPQVLLTASGVPMFYMGAELGMDTERTLDHNPLQWDNLDDPALAAIHEEYQQMIWLRNEYPALRSANINVVQKSNNQKTIVYHRTLDGDAGVVVAVNFNASDQTLDLEFPWSGTWYEYTQNDTLTIETNWFGGYTIPASSARIFTSDRRWVSVAEQAELPNSYKLYPAFPNPFNPVTNIRFDLPQESMVNVKIYDVRGRQVWSYEHAGSLSAGQHEIQWNARNDQGVDLSGGLYFVEFSTPEFRQVQKLMLLK